MGRSVWSYLVEYPLYQTFFVRNDGLGSSAARICSLLEMSMSRKISGESRNLERREKVVILPRYPSWAMVKNSSCLAWVMET